MSAPLITEQAPEAGDDAAQRLLNLVFMLNTSTRPLTTDEIVSDSDVGYGSPNRDSDVRKFRRDRERLATLGVIIKNVQPEGSLETEEACWAIDEASTFATVDTLSRDDLDLLIDAISHYLAIPGNPLSEPLAGVLDKARETRRLRDGAVTGVPEVRRNVDALVEAVWAAFAARRTLTFTYCDAKGTETRRTVAIYGLFSHEGTQYFTGADDVTGEVRTFRLDRVQRAWRPRKGYHIPDDFDIRAYLFLPFDFSSAEPLEAAATFPAASTAAERAAVTQGRGTFTQDDEGTWVWHIAVHDIDAMARYLLGHARDGVRPLKPTALVTAWNTLIDKAVRTHEDR